MPVQSFYPSFTLAARGADGFVDPLPNEELTIKNAADNSIIDTVESDGFGFVEGGVLASVPPETEIYFEHATYPNTLPIISTETADSAYYVNPVLTFLVGDEFTEEIEPDTVEVWMREGSEPYKLIGTAPVGGSVAYPFRSFQSKELDFRLFPIVEGMTQKVKRFEDAPSASASLASFGGEGEPDLQESRVIAFQIDLNTTDTQDIYTVPADLEFIFTKAVFRRPSEDLSASTQTLTILNGAGGTVFTQDLDAFTAINKYLVKRIDTVQPVYAETETLSADLSAAKGSAGSIWVDVFGYLLPADILDANYLTEDDGDQLTDDSGNFYIEG